MPTTALTLVLLAAVAVPPSLEPGALLAYRGSVAPLADDKTPGEAQKQFDLSLVVTQQDGQGTTFVWLLDEQGRGAWPWAHRFGRWQVSPAGAAAPGSRIPALLYDRGDGASVLPLAAPLLVLPDDVQPGGTWGEHPQTYEFRGAVQRDGQSLREVLLTNLYGRKRLSWLAPTQPLVVGYDETVFIGMGEQHELQLRLVGHEQLTAEQLAATVATVDALDALRADLKIAPQAEELHFEADQVALLAERLPGLVEKSGPTIFASLARGALADAKTQANRVDEVAELARQFVGQAPGEFRCAGLAGAALSAEQLNGQVTVLHFWDYRDEPLKEPYGQTGYLDFLHEQRRAAGVKVYGVAVDSRLDDPQQSGAATRSVRKLQSFMNLGYPLLLDSGTLLRQFGDPRRVGAALPLFVVIGRDGRIAHYHAGHYEVDRDQGLRELDAAIGRALAAPQ